MKKTTEQIIAEIKELAKTSEYWAAYYDKHYA